MARFYIQRRMLVVGSGLGVALRYTVALLFIASR